MIRIVILSGGDISTNIIYNYIKACLTIEKIIIEKKVSPLKLAWRRTKKLGPFVVFGQVLFVVFNRIFFFRSKSRIKEIISSEGLNLSQVETNLISSVSNVNSDETIKQLKELNPDLVLVSGTRIITDKVLRGVTCPFVNIHVGITPKYRGVHGAYWALAENDIENCGVTIHLVDRGIDAGKILFQERVQVTPADDFNTYPYLQLAKALPLLCNGLQRVWFGDIPNRPGSGASRLWHHPTLFQYLRNWLVNGVK